MNTAFVLERQIERTLSILSGYTAGKPFAPYLKEYFRNHKQMGSRDRRTVRNLCYAWFRLGYSLPVEKKDQVRMAYLFFYPEEIDKAGETHPALPNVWRSLELNERIAFLENTLEWKVENMFPAELLSKQIDRRQFAIYHLRQPYIWISVSDKDKQNVKKILESNQIRISEYEGIIGLESEQKLDEILPADSYEIQDLSSQLTLLKLNDFKFYKVWDVCAGSGGKSLNLVRKKPLEIFASDIRLPILNNLRHRFKKHKNTVMTSVADMEQAHRSLQFLDENLEGVEISGETFDLILVDVPCSGSGTWSRNPEHLFNLRKPSKSVLEKQQNILKNALPFAKNGAIILYMTCSVFESENEENLKQFAEIETLELIESGYIKGYLLNSDSMFFALFRKSDSGQKS